METAQLEEKVYRSLKEDETITGLLPNGDKSFFHLKAPSVYPNYPILVYSVISDVPVLHGDNLENLHRVTIRIHIISDENEYPPLYEAVRRVMSQLGFTRVQSTPFIDEYGNFMMIADFKILIGSE